MELIKKRQNQKVERTEKYVLSSSLKMLRDEYDMPVKPFDPDLCYSWLKQTNHDDETELLTTTKKIKDYIDKYIYELHDGGYIMYDVVDRQKTMPKQSKEGIKRVHVYEREATWKEMRRKEDTTTIMNYFDKLTGQYIDINKKLKKWFKSRCKLYRIAVELNEPFLFERNGIKYLNMSSKFKHTYNPDKSFNDFSDKTKEACELYFSFIKDVICGGNEDQFIYDTYHTAAICQGRKNDSIYLMIGEQGTGKSTKLDMLYLYILGKDVSIITGSTPLSTPFDKELMGKALVVFEELPAGDKSAWISHSEKLKALATCPEFSYNAKNKDPMTVQNINNIFISTNNETAVKDRNGRRVFSPDLSTIRKNDYSYWKKLRDTIFNDKVGEALFYYFNEIDLDAYPKRNDNDEIEYVEYNAQSCIPRTQQKSDAISENLDTVRKFIRDDYILRDKEFGRIRGSELYEQYMNYVELMKYGNPVMNKKFYTLLRNIGFEVKSSTGNLIYVSGLDLMKLKEISDKEQWITDVDKENAILRKEKKKQSKAEGEEHDEYVDKLEEMNITKDERIKELEARIKELEQLIKQPAQLAYYEFAEIEPLDKVLDRLNEMQQKQNKKEDNDFADTQTKQALKYMKHRDIELSSDKYKSLIRYVSQKTRTKDNIISKVDELKKEDYQEKIREFSNEFNIINLKPDEIIKSQPVSNITF